MHATQISFAARDDHMGHHLRPLVQYWAHGTKATQDRYPIPNKQIVDQLQEIYGRTLCECKIGVKKKN